MELIKKPFRIGNSMAVLVPIRWKDERIIIKPLKGSITKDVIEILNEKNLLSDVKGIYLFGSYARSEQDGESDIDILVVTNTKRGEIKSGNYEILLIPEKSLVKLIQKDLYLVCSIKEAVPLINRESLEKYKKLKKKINIKELLNEIESAIRINQEMIDSCFELNEKVPDGTIYSIVLRLRELYLLKSIILKNKPSKKDFMFFVDKNSYKAYLRAKREEKNFNNVEYKHANDLINLARKWINEIKERLKA